MSKLLKILKKIYEGFTFIVAITLFLFVVTGLVFAPAFLFQHYNNEAYLLAYLVYFLFACYALGDEEIYGRK